MRSFDRMEWPRRYQLKGSVLLLLVLGIIIGIVIHEWQNKAIAKSIVISELSFNDWGNQYIELGYTIENKTDKALKLKLLAKVWDQDEIELASALFEIEVAPKTRQTRSKMLDRLHRSLKDGERPGRANITLYLRKIL
jgi:hypothetical protein